MDDGGVRVGVQRTEAAKLAPTEYPLIRGIKGQSIQLLQQVGLRKLRSFAISRRATTIYRMIDTYFPQLNSAPLE